MTIHTRNPRRSYASITATTESPCIECVHFMRCKDRRLECDAFYTYVMDDEIVTSLRNQNVRALRKASEYGGDE